MSRILSGGRREVSITSTGLFITVILIAVGYAGINTHQNLLILITALLLSFVLVNWYLQVSTQVRIRLGRKAPPYIFAKTPFHVDVTLANRKLLYPAVSLTVGDLGENLVMRKEAYFLLVSARSEEVERYEAIFTKRGIQQFTKVYHRTRFPFGIIQRTQYFKFPGEVLVYPEVRPVEIPARAWTAQEGDPSRKKGDGRELLGFHDYEPGEDLRVIHWPTTARAGRPVAREFQEELHRRILIVLDDTAPEEPPPGFEEAFEEAIVQAASYVSSFLSRGFAVGLATSREGFQPDPGPAQFHTLMRFLALVQPNRSPGVSAPQTTGNRIEVGWRDCLGAKQE
jgi:uncharacterized protein (DUF58 family)